jgi:hypothetical protein
MIRLAMHAHSRALVIALFVLGYAAQCGAETLELLCEMNYPPDSPLIKLDHRTTIKYKFDLDKKLVNGKSAADITDTAISFWEGDSNDPVMFLNNIDRLNGEIKVWAHNRRGTKLHIEVYQVGSCKKNSDVKRVF